MIHITTSKSKSKNKIWSTEHKGQLPTLHSTLHNNKRKRERKKYSDRELNPGLVRVKHPS